MKGFSRSPHSVVNVRFFAAILIGTFVLASVVKLEMVKFTRGLPSVHRFRTVQHLTAGSPETKTGLTEKLEVSYPFVVQPSFGTAVASEKVIDHVYGQSYGSPTAVDYTPPEGVKFNKVVATLDTTVGGVQFDRLAHLFIEGVEIWRTSTIEPSGESHSVFSKDISSYSTLFQRPGKLSFELNNNVDNTYTGKFHVILTLDYYFDESYAGFEKKYDSLSDLLEIGSAPSRILPLIKKDADITKPEIALPQQPFEVPVPELYSNTSNVKLSVFTSGNADEEFWYTNVLDRFTTYFSNDSFFGHGPIRFVEVYVNDVLYFTQVPDPVVFTGGISPALWSPVVSGSAFDLRSIDFDLSPLLPVLQASGAKISIKIDNGVDHTPVGSNWITTANLHIWEDESVQGVKGDVVGASPPKKCDAVSIGQGKDGFVQIIYCKRSVDISGDLTYELTDSVVEGSYSHASFVKGENVQKYQSGGSLQSIIHNGKTKHTVSATGGSEVSTEVKYPLVLMMSVENTGSDTTFGVFIALEKEFTDEVDGERTSWEYSGQNGTSTFTVSPKGNHGTGSLWTDYKLVSDSTTPGSYRRQVRTKDNAIVVDEENEDGDSLKLDTAGIEQFFAASGGSDMVDLLNSDHIIFSDV